MSVDAPCAARFIVRGKVQGVWFRAGTREVAVQLGLRGFASNLRNGDVEVVAVGDAEAMQRLAAWLQHGPPMARVDAVQRAEADPAGAPQGFEIR